MKRSDIEKAALDVYARVLAREWPSVAVYAGGLSRVAQKDVEASADACENALAAYHVAIKDLEQLSLTVTKRKRAILIAPTVEAGEILQVYRQRLPRLPQPTEPIEPSVWALLNAAARRDSVEKWDRRFKAASRSSFCMGKDGHFCASLPWLLKPSVAADIDGGKYGGMS